MSDAKYPGRWEAGEQILQQDLWGGRLVTSRPVTVVADLPDYLALYTHPKAPFRSCGIRNRYSIPVTERVDIYIDMINPDVGQLEERASGDNHVLTLTRPDSWYSIWLFWTVDCQFKTWYVNFQAPIHRTARGIIVQDYALDIVVEPDMSWSWKDEDEYSELCRRGFFTDRQISSITAEGDRVIQAIEDSASPFSDGWENWRADTNWPVPEIPVDWDIPGTPKQQNWEAR